MKFECIDINELTDSREIMQQKAPKSSYIFISVIAALLIIALIWAMFGRIDNYITATGEIRTDKNISTVTSLISGKIIEKNFNDNVHIEKGDIIISIDCSYYISQKQILESQKNNNLSNISNYEKLITAIENDKNLFDENNEKIYFLKYEEYATKRDSSVNQIADKNSQTSLSINEIEKSILESNNSISQLNEEIAEYERLYLAIEKSENFDSQNTTIKNLFENYILSLKKATAVYEQYKLSYDELRSQSGVTEIQLSQPYQTMVASKADVDLVKSNILISINDTIVALKQEVENHKINIENCNSKKASLKFDNTSNTIKESLKDTYSISINNEITALKKENINLDAQIAEIDEAINNSNIIAESSGTLMYTAEYALGDNVSTGTVIASIVPESKELVATIYFPEQYAADIKENQCVEYVFTSISTTDFGKVYGQINEVSVDSFVDESSGQRFYKAIASIDKTALKNKKGEIKHLKAGMTAEVHAITETQSILSWLLDKLNFN